MGKYIAYQTFEETGTERRQNSYGTLIPADYPADGYVRKKAIDDSNKASYESNGFTVVTKPQFQAYLDSFKDHAFFAEERQPELNRANAASLKRAGQSIIDQITDAYESSSATAKIKSDDAIRVTPLLRDLEFHLARGGLLVALRVLGKTTRSTLPASYRGLYDYATALVREAVKEHHNYTDAQIQDHMTAIASR
jgi:hypothetical protein